MSAPSDRPATLEDYAGAEFEPWSGLDFAPPTVEEWCAPNNPHLVAIRLAYCTVQKTKGDLADMPDAVGRESFEALLEALRCTESFLKGYQALVETAHLRLLSAAAVTVMRPAT